MRVIIETGRRLHKLLDSSLGQTLVEYSLILAFITTIIVGVAAVAIGTDGLIGNITSRLAAALGG